MQRTSSRVSCSLFGGSKDALIARILPAYGRIRGAAQIREGDTTCLSQYPGNLEKMPEAQIVDLQTNVESGRRAVFRRRRRDDRRGGAGHAAGFSAA